MKSGNNGSQIEVSDLIEVYKRHVSELMNEKIHLQAQVFTLQKELAKTEEGNDDGRQGA
jgi:predicted XRE-type DNA-binding protein